jgi:ferredoxin-NADP reductase/DMSO/TMAO reductase YedYZ heme-binding membrane subunit
VPTIEPSIADSASTGAAAPQPLLDATLARRLALVNGAVPLAMLAWDALHGRLGVNAVNYVIRTTGILGLIFLTASLAITPLRLLTGWNVLIAFRRRLGVYSFVYIAAHFVTYFAFDRAASVSDTLHEILMRRYLQVGIAGLIVLTPLALTSTDAMVSRLGARRWKRLHRGAYVAAVLGVLHYAMLVKSDLRQPIAFAVTLGALLAFRVVRHFVEVRALSRRTARAAARAAAASAAAGKKRFWKGELRVARVFDETPDVKTFRLRAVDGGPLPFEHQPGQYLNLTLTIAGEPVRRSYTIASSPTRGDYCEITVRRTAGGYASAHLHQALREGSVLSVAAPAGRFVFTGTAAERVVLIAGGVGITPLMAIVRALTDRCWPGQIHLVFAARTQRDVIFDEELRYLQKRFANLHVCVVLSREPDGGYQGERGRVTAELLARVVPGLPRGPFYVCGPDGMMDAVRAELASLGVAPAEVFTEAFVSPGTPGSTESASESPEVVRSGAPEAEPQAREGIATVHFERSNCTAEVSGEKTILEAAEDSGVGIPFECRSGICGQCKTRVLRGSVTMDVQDALTTADRRRGLILACQARATRDVALDA